MSNYTKTTDFEAKDSLPSGDSEKIIKGAEFETEFDAISTAIATKSDTADPAFTGTATFVTANVNALQIAGVAVSSTAAELNILDGVTSTAGEINKLDGFTGTFEDLNYAKDLRASGVTAAEFDILDGLTATATELNILDGATVTTAELNLLDGVTSTTAELNILDGVTATAANLNVLAGTTLTSSDLPYFDRASNTNGRVEDSKVVIADSDGSVEFRDGGTLSWNDGDLSISNANNTQTTFNATYKVVFDGDEWIFREADNTLMADFTSGTAKLYKDGTARLTTTTSGVDVTGSVTADGLTVDGNATISGASNGLRLTETDTTDLNTYITNQAGNLRLRSANDAYSSFTTRFQVDHATGDISFYEDTGTTAKFFWDASAESLGIGNSAPQAGVHVTQDATQLILAGAAGSNDKFIAFDVDLVADVDTHFITVDQADALAFGEKLNDNDRAIENEWMRITNSGQVGIGIDTPAETLHVAGNVRIGSTTPAELYTNSAELRLGADRNNDNDISNITFYANDSEKVRMDKDGHFIVPNGVTLGVAVDAYAASNTLNDYEEGTFTPVIADASSGGNTGTAATLDGHYTKIGRQVTINVRIDDLDTTGMTGANNLFIRGLPFVAGSGSTGQSQGSLRLDRADLDANCCGIVCSSTSNSSYLTLRQTIDNSADVQIKVQDFTSGSADLFATITYFV